MGKERKLISLTKKKKKHNVPDINESIHDIPGIQTQNAPSPVFFNKNIKQSRQSDR